MAIPDRTNYKMGNRNKFWDVFPIITLGEELPHMIDCSVSEGNLHAQREKKAHPT